MTIFCLVRRYGWIAVGHRRRWLRRCAHRNGKRTHGRYGIAADDEISITTIDGALVYKGKGKKVDVPNSGVYIVGIRGVIVKWRFGKACFYISEKGASVRRGLCLVDACTFCFFAVLS